MAGALAVRKPAAAVRGAVEPRPRRRGPCDRVEWAMVSRGSWVALAGTVEEPVSVEPELGQAPADGAHRDRAALDGRFVADGLAKAGKAAVSLDRQRALRCGEVGPSGRRMLVVVLRILPPEGSTPSFSPCPPDAYSVEDLIASLRSAPRSNRGLPRRAHGARRRRSCSPRPEHLPLA